MMINKYGYILEESEINAITSRVHNLVNSQEFQALIQGKLYREQAMRYKKKSALYRFTCTN
ncbi:MAG: hypothetical protein Q9M43_04230 [Sulfurimonas sp.]|nr:hypothetical protein [Sulfurimonas sp.]